MSSTALALVILAAIIAVIVLVVGGLCLVYLNEEKVRATGPGRVLLRFLDAVQRLLDKFPTF